MKTDAMTSINAWYYSMRACGQGHGGISTFTALMDMPGSMTSKNYDNLVNKFTAATKDVAK